MTQYIKYNGFILTLFVNCVSVSEAKILFSHTHTQYQCVSILQATVAALCQYIRDKTFFFTHCWFQFFRQNILSSPTFDYTVSVYERHQIFPHPLLVKLCQYIRGKNFSLTHFVYIVSVCQNLGLNFTQFWLHCVFISEATFLSSPTVGYSFSVCQMYKFILTHSWLHCFSTSEATVLSSHFCLYCVSISDTTFYSEPLLFTVCQCIRDNRFILTHSWLHRFSTSEATVVFPVTLFLIYRTEQFYPHPLLVTRCQYIRDNIFILTQSWFHSFSISEATVFPNIFSCTLSLYQTQHFYPQPLLITMCQCIRDNSFILTHFCLGFVNISDTIFVLKFIYFLLYFKII